MKRLFVLPLALCAALACAQDGPGYPCQGCLDDQPAFDQPTSALWYVVDRPGTGISLTVQNGFAVGVYYGFTEAGKPLWYLFTGLLEQPDDAPNRLRLTAPLQRVENGPCLGCAWQAPDYLDSPGDATLEFDQANHAKLTLPSSQPVDMVPFIAGVGHRQWLPSYTDYDFPNLEGKWVILHETPNSSGEISYSSRIGWFEYFSDSFRIDEMINWTLWESDAPSDLYTQLDLMCRFNGRFSDEDPHSSDLPDCWLSDIVDIPGSDQLTNRLDFPVPYANIGASRISAVHPETGVRLTMYRLEYD